MVNMIGNSKRSKNDNRNFNVIPKNTPVKLCLKCDRCGAKIENAIKTNRKFCDKCVEYKKRQVNNNG